MLVSDIVSLSIFVCFIVPIVIYQKTNNIIYLYILVGLLFSEVFNHLLKLIFGIRYDAYKRPKGAKNCNAFNAGGDCSGKPGFPSGHVSLLVSFIVMSYLFTGSPVYIILGIPWSIAMGWSRIQKKCHTLIQVIGGYISGVFVGFFWYYAVKWLQK